MHEVVKVIEKFSCNNESIGIFLDIEGAFNNVTTDAIEEVLTESNVNLKIK